MAIAAASAGVGDGGAADSELGPCGGGTGSAVDTGDSVGSVDTGDSVGSVGAVGAVDSVVAAGTTMAGSVAGAGAGSVAGAAVVSMAGAAASWSTMPSSNSGVGRSVSGWIQPCLTAYC